MSYGFSKKEEKEVVNNLKKASEKEWYLPNSFSIKLSRSNNPVCINFETIENYLTYGCSRINLRIKSQIQIWSYYRYIYKKLKKEQATRVYKDIIGQFD